MIARPARETDAARIVELIREAFHEQVMKHTIFGCTGIINYLELQISLPDHVASHSYTVAEDADGDVVGCLDIVKSSGGAVLNYAAVRPRHRGQGIGTILFRTGIASLGTDRSTMLLLDVLQSNQLALRWYVRLGFEHVASRAWWVTDMPHGRPDRAIIVDYPQAEAVHRRFGFSQINVLTDRGHAVTLGRLGDDLMRIHDVSLLEDEDIWGAARTVAPTGCRVLVVTPLPPPPGTLAGHDHVFAIDRMEAPMRTVLGRLGMA